MKYDVTHILTLLKNDVKGTDQGHLEIRKNENKTQIYSIRLDSVFKKKQVSNP